MFDTLCVLEAAGHENIMKSINIPCKHSQAERPEYQIGHIGIDLVYVRPYDYMHIHKAMNQIRKMVG